MKNLEKKIKETLPEFYDIVQSLDVQSLEKMVSDSAKNIEDIQEAKEMDEGLKDAFNAWSQAKAPYSDATKVTKLKIKYLIHIIKSKN